MKKNKWNIAFKVSFFFAIVYIVLYIVSDPAFLSAAIVFGSLSAFFFYKYKSTNKTNSSGNIITSKANLCPICNEFNDKNLIKIADGEICYSCYKKINDNIITPESFKKSKNMLTLDTAKEILNEKDIISSKGFKPVVKYSTFSADTKSGLFRVNQLFDINKSKSENQAECTYEFSKILSYDVVEDGVTITSGGLGRAAIGAITFGGIGAIVGSVTGGKKQRKYVDNLKIIVNMDNVYTPVIRIPILQKKTKTSSNKYRQATEDVENIISILENQVKKLEKNNNINNTKSIADEIRDFKTLFDDGIITSEEFEQKKKDLLGI